MKKIHGLQGLVIVGLVLTLLALEHRAVDAS